MSNFELDELSPRASRDQARKGLAMDLVLVLLGGSTIWLAGRYLSFEDTRPFYNAWTYVMAIPLGVAAIDLLLRTIVSRFVERTLQVAFLMSMLVHLLVTMSAIHVVLFAHRESDLPTSLMNAVSAQKQPSSVPEYFQTSDSQSANRPDYLRPIATAESDAAASETEKLEVEHPSALSAPAETPDTTVELPRPRVAKTESKLDDPEILSQKARLERPLLAAAIPDVLPSIEVPETVLRAELVEQVPLEAVPTEAAANQAKSDSALEVPQTARFEPDPLLSIEPNRSLSKSPQRRQRDDFELPAIENRKTELAKRELSPERDAAISEISVASASLLEIPKAVSGEFTDQLPPASVDKPSDIRGLTKSVGERRFDSSLGGSTASAALEGLAEAGARDPKSAQDLALSMAPSLSRRSEALENIQVAGIPKIAIPTPLNGKLAPTIHSPIPLPEGAGPIAESSDRRDSEAIAASSLDSEKKPRAGELLGSGETIRGLALGFDDLRPSVDIHRSEARSLAAAGGRKGSLPEIEAWIDTPGLPGPKRLPRLPSARPTPDAPAVPIPVPAFQQRMARNDGSADSSDLGEFGPATEAAIERGLEFLAKNQRADGSWQLEDFGDQPRLRSQTAATALSLLAFQGAGYSHRQYHYAPVCKSALEFLLAHQLSNGDLYIPMDEASNANARFYSHSIAALALCEAYGMTQDDALREPAQRAVDFMVRTQDPIGGGWRYQPGLESDTSVSGWFMMALKSAELSGLEVPKSTFEAIRGWLDKAQASPDERFLYRYNPLAADTPATRHGRIPNPTMTGVGLLMRLYLGWRRDTADMMRGADYLLEFLPTEGTPLNPKRDTYYWYYATQVLFHMGGERWKQWNSHLHPLLIRSQEVEGEQVGSWNPSGPIPDRWGPFAGRLYVTTLNLLSLEVYYRHLPIYEDTAR